jgi:ApaG protein
VEEEFQATTAGINVSVAVQYLQEQSQPEHGRFVWAYRVRISNATADTVKLLSRSWRITDAHGHVMLVEGEGVVGKQPVLEPGTSFEYTSGTPLPTPSGFMTGCYHMLYPATGKRFDIAIPVFSLDCPHQNHQIH